MIAAETDARFCDFHRKKRNDLFPCGIRPGTDVRCRKSACEATANPKHFLSARAFCREPKMYLQGSKSGSTVNLGVNPMKNLNLMASAMTISIAAFAVTAARADCAQDLASLKSQTAPANSASSNGSVNNSGALASNSSASASSQTPANQDQAAVNGKGETYTAKNAPKSMTGKGDATGGLSGIAPTAALGDQAKTGDDTAKAETSGNSKADTDPSAGDTAKMKGQAKSDGEAMTNMSGTEATTMMGKAAANQTGQDTSARTATSSGSGSSSASSKMAKGDTSNSGSGKSDDAMSTASTSNGQPADTDMVQQHMAAAQAALDRGNEEACVAAVLAIKQSM